MKKYSLILFLFPATFFIQTINGQEVFKSEISDSLKTIAIIPFSITNDIKGANQSTNEIEQVLKEESFFLQEYFFALLQQRIQNELLTIKLLDVQKTNMLLDLAKIHKSGIQKIARQRLAEIVKSDMIVNVSFVKSLRIKANGNIVQKIEAKFSIYDKKGSLIWYFSDYESSGEKKSSLQLSKKLLERACRKFPFGKRKGFLRTGNLKKRESRTI